MASTRMILIVEDDPGIALSLTAQITRENSKISLSVVADKENAIKALTRQIYREYDPLSRSFREHSPASFVAVIWDNNFPESEGGEACCDVGLETIQTLKASRKVQDTVLTHFISHSSDEQLPLMNSGHFFKIYPKPIKKEQVKELCDLVENWSLDEACDVVENCSLNEASGSEFY